MRKDILQVVSLLSSLFILTSCALFKDIKHKIDTEPKQISQKRVYIGNTQRSDDVDQKMYNRWLRSNVQVFDLESPTLSDAEVEKIFVPDRIVGNEYHTSFYRYVIKKNPSWTRD